MSYPKELPWQVSNLDQFKQALEHIRNETDDEQKVELLEALSRKILDIPAADRVRARRVFVASKSDFQENLFSDELKECFRVLAYMRSDFALQAGEPRFNVGRYFLNMSWIQTAEKSEILGWPTQDDWGTKDPVTVDAGLAHQALDAVDADSVATALARDAFDGEP